MDNKPTEIFITTVSKEEYKDLTEREKSLYDAGKKKGEATGHALSFLLGLMMSFLVYVICKLTTL